MFWTSDTKRSASHPTALPFSTGRLPTLGGLQFWTDVYLFQNWRIQKHVRTGAHRLLGPNNFQHTTGDFHTCKNRFDEIRRKLGLAPWQGESVILIHGLVRTRYCMNIMAEHIRSAGYYVYAFGYPSLQSDITSHATALATVIGSLETSANIHLVGFSMGGLIARAALEINRDPRIHRLVTLGTPNQGADKALLYERLGLLHLAGPGATQLVPGPRGIVHRLAPNPAQQFNIEVGVLAAGGPNGRGYSMTLPPDNDGVVTVQSTFLEGAADFTLVRGMHAFLPSLLSVRKATKRFLKHGHF